MLEDARQPKVSELHVVPCVQEHIGRLEVAVQHRAPAGRAPVALAQRQHKLRQHPQDKLLLQEAPARQRLNGDGKGDDTV